MATCLSSCSFLFPVVWIFSNERRANNAAAAIIPLALARNGRVDPGAAADGCGDIAGVFQRSVAAEFTQDHVEDRCQEDANIVTPIMPEKTAIPMARRISAPAPIDVTSARRP